MKKIIISLVALASIAGAASAAGNRSYDLRDLETQNGYSSDGVFLPAFKSTAKSSYKIVKPASAVIDHTGEHQNSTN
jgi:hypothetical protein